MSFLQFFLPEPEKTIVIGKNSLYEQNLESHEPK